MTDNEKAAFYHPSWRPNEKCDGWSHGGGYVVLKCERCGMEQAENDVIETSVGLIHITKPHDRAAPDMSRPENYIRALEAGDFGYEMIYDPELSGKWWSVDIYRDDRRNRVALGESRISGGDAATTALARLYDHEHPNG